MKIEYQEYTIEDVIKYFVKPWGKLIKNYKYYIDTSKGVILFQLFVDDEIEKEYEAAKADLSQTNIKEK